jgi:hypothetical protein
MLDLFEKVTIKQDLPQEVSDIFTQWTITKQRYSQLILLNNSYTENSISITGKSLYEFAIKELEEGFKGLISRTLNYYRKTYNLEKIDFDYNRNDYNIKYYSNSDLQINNILNFNPNDIITSILTQANGNLQGTATQEFISKIKGKIGYKMTPKTNKIQISDLVWRGNWDNNLSFNCRENVYLLFKSINYIIQNSINDIYKDLLDKLCGYDSKFNPYSTHELYLLDCSIKIFKNGRVDIIFQNYETANKYYNTYYSERG